MFEKLTYLLIGILVPLVFGLMRFSINNGDFHQNELVFISFCFIFLTGFVWYMQKTGSMKISLLTKKQCLQLLMFLTLEIAFLCIYSILFKVTSDSSSSFASDKLVGYTVSYVLAVSIFSPIEEELVMRGLLQQGVFRQSWIGLLLTSCLFSMLHGPSDMVSFLYYMMSGAIYGMAYKQTDNLLVPILCHIGHNSFVILSSLVF